MPAERDELLTTEKQVRALLSRLAGDQSGITRRMRMVDLKPEQSTKEHVPRRPRAGRTRCCVRLRLGPVHLKGDPVRLSGIGTVRPRTSTNLTRTCSHP
jgi:hypothetical protein